MAAPKKEDKAQVATGAETGSGLAVPASEEELFAFMSEAKGEGLELVKSDDIILPRLSIIQGLSPQVKERLAGPGDIFNVVSKVNYGMDGLKFVPLFFWGSRIQWSSKDPGATMVCIARDAEHGSVKDAAHGMGVCLNCPKKEFGVDDSGKTTSPDCTDYKNVLLIPFPDGENWRHQMPVVYSAKRAAIGPFKEFLSAANGFQMKGVKLPLYTHIWQLKSVNVTSSQGDYYNPKFTDMGMIQDMEMLKHLQGIARAMKESQSKFVVTDDNEPAAGSGGGEAVTAEFVETTGKGY